MKILYVITSMRMGGAEKLVVALAAAMISRGHQVDVALFDGTQTELKSCLENTGCKIYSLSMGGSVYSPSLVFKLRKISKDYDIVHTHNSSPQLFAALANAFRKKPQLVTTEHSTFNRRRKMWWYKPIDRRMYRKYASTICISDIAYKKLTSYLGTSSGIITINNGIDVLAYANAAANEELKPSKGNFAVVMVAALRAEKDQQTLIRAISLLPHNYRLWIVGDGPMRGFLENLARELNVEDRVVFFGWRTDVPQILKSADVVAMASHYEGLSLSSIEGMAVGKPFICSDVDGLREIVAGAGVLVKDSDSKGFADKIKELCLNKTYSSEVAEACYARAMEYDFSKMAEAYNNVYLTLKKTHGRKEA